MQIWTFWLIVAGFFFLLEIATEGFLVCWIGIGALCAMALSFFFPEAIIAQLILMCVISIFLILSTKN